MIRGISTSKPEVRVEQAFPACWDYDSTGTKPVGFNACHSFETELVSLAPWEYAELRVTPFETELHITGLMVMSRCFSSV